MKALNFVSSSKHCNPTCTGFLVGQGCWTGRPFGSNMVNLASLGWRRSGGMFGFLTWDWRPFELKYRTTLSLQTVRPIVIHVWRLLGILFKLKKYTGKHFWTNSEFQTSWFQKIRTDQHVCKRRLFSNPAPANTHTIETTARAICDPSGSATVLWFLWTLWTRHSHWAPWPYAF